MSVREHTLEAGRRPHPEIYGVLSVPGRHVLVLVMAYIIDLPYSLARQASPSSFAVAAPSGGRWSRAAQLLPVPRGYGAQHIRVEGRQALGRGVAAGAVCRARPCSVAHQPRPRAPEGGRAGGTGVFGGWQL